MQNIQLSPFEHHCKVMEGLVENKPAPTSEELLSRALAWFSSAAAGAAEAGVEVAEVGAGEALTEEAAAGNDEARLPEMSPDYTVRPQEPDSPAAEMQEDPAADQENVAPRGHIKAPRPAKQKQPVVETQWSFQYFKSEMGLQFLMDTGVMIPDGSTQAGIQKEKRPRPPPPQPQRTPWNPRLVGEPGEEEEEQMDQEQYVQEEAPWSGNSPPHSGVAFNGQGTAQDFNSVPEDGTYFSPGARMPIVAEQHEAPIGPHPNKKGPLWDVYGEPRGDKAKIAQAYVEINQKYLEVEGATDRRVRTSSVAHKKNSCKAPSVSTVRKTGQHAVGRGSELGAKEILGEMGLAATEEHWKLSSTMQGLGDPNQLVEVMPGACRFGPLRLGSLYRMSFFVRNKDVDVTRFNVKPPDSDMVKVHWTPGHLAPGMATKITVEVAAITPTPMIEQLVEIHVKAHIVRVPVTARVIDEAEYDRLDAESFALHGRKIGRHRERNDAQKPGPVQLVIDPEYCKKVMGYAYHPPPPDFDEQPEELS